MDVRVGAVAQDPRDARERLDVVHECRGTEQPGDGRVRRASAHLGPAVLERVQQRRLLAADVAALAVHDLHVEGGAALADFAEDAGRAGLGGRVLDGATSLRVLLADVHVPAGRSDGVRGDRHRLEHAVRVVLEDEAVDVRAGVTFVGVAHDVLLVVASVVHGPPLAAGGERGATTPAQRRPLDLLDDRHG
jgi:hypothetical protein